MIADELEQIDKNLIIGGELEEDGKISYRSIDTLYLIGYLTKGIQELSQQVKQLQAKLDNI